jgi:hypothetical protein
VLPFQNVSFSYSGNAEGMLYKDLEFGIDCDSRIALVGPNGAGEQSMQLREQDSAGGTKRTAVFYNAAHLLRCALSIVHYCSPFGAGGDCQELTGSCDSRMPRVGPMEQVEGAGVNLQQQLWVYPVLLLHAYAAACLS